MNKSDIINEIAKNFPDKTQVKEIVDKVFDISSTVLKKGDKVTISNFGTFHSRNIKARQYRNPKTGEAVSLPSRQTVKFKLSKNFF